jgi:hypothetical protein
MSAFSDYLENEVLDHVFKTGAYTPATNLFVALYSAAPTDAGGGTELTSANSGYERQVCNSWNAAGSGEVDNAIDIIWGTSGANWGTVVAVGIFDASAVGNLLVYGSLNSTIEIVSGTKFKIPAA